MIDTLDQYPEIIAVIVLIAGILAANLLAAIFDRAVTVIQSFARRRTSLRSELISQRSRLVARRIIYYLTITVFILGALKILGIGMLSDWLNVVFDFVPQLVSGIAIIFVGYLAGLLTFSLVASVTVSDRMRLLPRLAQIVVVVTAVMTGLAQMAIDVSFITDVIVVFLVTLLGGMSLAFGIGSRAYVANILALRDLERYKIGDRIRIDDVEGTVIAHYRTGLVLQSPAGEVDIPASKFSECIVTRLSDL